MPVPIDLAMTPLGLAQPRRLWLIALVGALGSLAGALLGYLLGAVFLETVGRWLIELYGMQDGLSSLERQFDELGWVAIFVAALTPIPFKLAAIAAGALGMRVDLFVLAVFGSRLIRFGLMAVVIRIFGAGLDAVLRRWPGPATALAIGAMIFGMACLPLVL